MAMSEAHLERMKMAFTQWSTKLDEILVKADEADTEPRIDYRQRVDDLKLRYQLAHSKLSELRTTRTGTVETGTEDAWYEPEFTYKAFADPSGQRSPGESETPNREIQ